MNKIAFLIIILLFANVSFSQTNEVLISKLKNIKELLEMDLISQNEFDSISKNLVEQIMDFSTDSNSKTTLNDSNSKTLVDSNESNNLNFSFDDLYSNEFIYNGRMIKELGFGGIFSINLFTRSQKK